MFVELDRASPRIVVLLAVLAKTFACEGNDQALPVEVPERTRCEQIQRGTGFVKKRPRTFNRVLDGRDDRLVLGDVGALFVAGT
jgi:hypothetical protein